MKIKNKVKGRPNRIWALFPGTLKNLKKTAIFSCVLFENEAHQIDCKHELTAEQWKVLAHIEIVLRPFAVVMKLLEREKYVTASWVPIIAVERIRVKFNDGLAADQPAPVRKMTEN